MVILATVGLGMLVASGLNEIGKKEEAYSGALPSDITKNIRLENNDDEDQRIISALVGNKLSKKIEHSTLNQDKLSEIASETNAAIIHCSGNCNVLSVSLLYNLIKGETRIGVKNTSPAHKGSQLSHVSQIIFNADLETVSTVDTVEAMQAGILAQYKKTGERFFAIKASGYQLPLIGSTGHGFNAVVLFNDKKEPYVQFVDAWKTSNSVPSSSELASKYGEDATFTIYTRPKDL